jgi:SAM-dependent methyltransferase
MPGFLDRFRSVPLGEVFAADDPVSIRSEDLGWLDLPDAGFLGYARGATAFSFDRLVPDPEQYVEGATFLLAQSHRIWLTVRKLIELFPGGPGSALLNLGAFPFSIDRILRDLFNLECRMISTYNQHLSPELQELLLRYRIETAAVNLDPFVATGEAPPHITDRLPLPDASVDCVLMAHVIEHLYHPLTCLREAVRVLKPGGTFLLTTDNAFLLGAFLQFLGDRRFVHEPVSGTAAMNFHAWRGHVRFYSGDDLRTLLEAAGLASIGVSYHEVLYNSLPEEYFVTPNVTMPEWRMRLLTEFPDFRNEVFIWGQKPAG